MTELRQINGTLCRMVEPTPLQPDSPMPCVVRLIQDDSRLGILNKLLHEGCYQDVFICSSCNEQVCHISIDGEEYDDFYPKYEIIGYPVVEGSIEWAWYQRCMLDIPVIGPNGVTPNNNFTLKQWCGQYRLTSMKTGWRLYEPEPEPDFRVGDWVKCERKDKSTFQAMVNHTNLINGCFSIQYDVVEDVTTRMSASPEKLHKTVIGIARPDGSVDGETFVVVRKLKPSEVVVHIGCLSGTVRRSSSSHFCIICGDHWSMIAFAMLDTTTRSLVESLLKAQEEGK